MTHCCPTVPPPSSPDLGQRDVHDRDVQRDQEEPQRRQHQRHPGSPGLAAGARLTRIGRPGHGSCVPRARHTAIEPSVAAGWKFLLKGAPAVHPAVDVPLKIAGYAAAAVHSSAKLRVPRQLRASTS